MNIGEEEKVHEIQPAEIDIAPEEAPEPAPEEAPVEAEPVQPAEPEKVPA